MHLSNFRPVKRVCDVVKIFARVAKEIPAQLVLVGDGPDRSAAEWLAHDLGIHSRVHFLGKQDRVNELLPLADLMLMPSELESFGLAALEAMACKVPSISTRVGGVPELIDDGVTGLLYPVGDVEAMAQGALALLSDRNRLNTMRDAGRRVAQKRFCSTKVIPQYVYFYEQVLNGYLRRREGRRCEPVFKELPSGAEAPMQVRLLQHGVKPCPFKALSRSILPNGVCIVLRKLSRQTAGRGEATMAEPKKATTYHAIARSLRGRVTAARTAQSPRREQICWP